MCMIMFFKAPDGLSIDQQHNPVLHHPRDLEFASLGLVVGGAVVQRFNHKEDASYIVHTSDEKMG